MTKNKIMIRFTCENPGCGKECVVFRHRSAKTKPRYCSRRCNGLHQFMKLKETDELVSLRRLADKVKEGIVRGTVKDKEVILIIEQLSTKE